MSCREIIQWLMPSRPRSGPLSERNATEQQPYPSDAQLEIIKSILTAKLEAVSPLLPTRVLLASVVALMASLLTVSISILGSRGWAVMTPVARASLIGPLLAGLLLSCGALVRSTSPESTGGGWLAVGSIGLIGLWFGAVMYELADLPEAHFFISGARCATFALVECGIGLAGLRMMIRPSSSLDPVVTAVHTGVASALLGLTMSQIRCPNLHLLHALVWHVPMLFIAAGAGIVARVNLKRHTAGLEFHIRLP